MENSETLISEFLYSPIGGDWVVILLPCWKHLVETSWRTQLTNSGVRVFNCSPVSDLDRFTPVSYEYALSR